MPPGCWPSWRRFPWKRNQKQRRLGATGETTQDWDGKHQTGEWITRGGRARYHGAGGYRGRLLQNRVPARAAGAQRVRAPVRTHDVSGLRECAEDATHQAGQFQRRRAERLDELRWEELLRNCPF